MRRRSRSASATCWTSKAQHFVHVQQAECRGFAAPEPALPQVVSVFCGQDRAMPRWAASTFFDAPIGGAARRHFAIIILRGKQTVRQSQARPRSRRCGSCRRNPFRYVDVHIRGFVDGGADRAGRGGAYVRKRRLADSRITSPSFPVRSRLPFPFKTDTSMADVSSDLSVARPVATPPGPELSLSRKCGPQVFLYVACQCPACPPPQLQGTLRQTAMVPRH